MNLLIKIIVLIVAISAYFLLWPVPIAPVAWHAPLDKGFTGDFEQNDELSKIERLALVDREGPEDLAIDRQGRIYCSVLDGSILRLDKRGEFSVWAKTHGRPLGIEFDQKGNLIVADAYKGLLSIDVDAQVTVLTNALAHSPIRYANDVDIAPDGKIYFSDASTKFSAKDFGGTYPASLLDLMEHGGHGRVLVYDPADKSTTLLVDGLNFANGVAVSRSGESLLINETGNYRVLRIGITPDDYAKTSVIIDNLPGFPDNLSKGQAMKGGGDVYWLGLVSPRNALIDSVAQWPLIRKIAQRLPTGLRPKAQKYSHVLAISDKGDVIYSLQDPQAKFAYNTGVLETQDYLYISSLHEKYLGRILKSKINVH